jgi:3-phenylpropionate/trans-cinnamate dioxygenase ferredoxin reductase subunit
MPPSARNATRWAISSDLPQRRFWSNQYDLRLETVGVLAGQDATIVRGGPETSQFAVIYLAGTVVVAVDTVNSPKDFAHAKKLIGQEVEAWSKRWQTRP